MNGEEGPVAVAERTPLVEMRGINVAFGGVHAVREASIDVHAGEVMGLVGGNGAGKSTLMKVLSGAHPADSGEILVDGNVVTLKNPRDAKAQNIETIYQTLALADNIDAPGNASLGREPTTRRLGFLPALDRRRMRAAAREVLKTLEIEIVHGVRSSIFLSAVLARDSRSAKALGAMSSMSEISG